ncbi:hypothetical protein RHECIAT_CH0000531 [Rhizobium etli CIAT 652]|uniref:Uncharacterized protein n=1 Tax=Rhizobium etli (strain CIAT 652) TaxID=491916 RepID=B3Q092_RHIE6|nr:hypothetical protein RHECIAT_CH0000531 [Rhizobium etli CIAT 652]
MIRTSRSFQRPFPAMIAVVIIAYILMMCIINMGGQQRRSVVTATHFMQMAPRVFYARCHLQQL